MSVMQPSTYNKSGPLLTDNTNLNRDTTNTSAIWRRSAGTSDVDITAIYSECVKLSATNKINTRNAFGLRLIDYMSYLLKQRPDEQINFKLVSSALDAGSKIYGNRVDCVHAEAQKVASGLVIALDKEKDNEKGARAMEDDDIGDDEGLMQDGMRTKRRKFVKKSIKTIVTNSETIMSKLVECNPPPNPLFCLLASSFDIGNVTSLLTFNLTHHDTNGFLIMSNNNDAVEKEWTELENPTAAKELLRTEAAAQSVIEPKMNRFEFLQRDGDVNASLSTIRATADSCDRISVFDDNFAQDNDDGPCPDFVDDPVMSDGDETLCDNQDNNPFTEPVQKLVDLDNEHANEILTKIFSGAQESDYVTPLHKDFEGAWAGPEFCKLAKTRQKKSPNSKSIRKNKVLFEEIDFSQSTFPTEEDCKKGATTLRVDTMLKWPDRILPNDISYDPAKLLKPFLKENATFKTLKIIPPETLNNKKSDPTHDDDNESINGMCSPPPDTVMDHDDHFDEDYHAGSQGFPAQVFTQDPAAGDALFTGTNLIDEPYLISSTQLPFSTVAKKIDVKKLKREMWSFLSVETSSSTQPTAEPSETSDVSPRFILKSVTPNTTLYFLNLGSTRTSRQTSQRESI